MKAGRWGILQQITMDLNVQGKNNKKLCKYTAGHFDYCINIELLVTLSGTETITGKYSV